MKNPLVNKSTQNKEKMKKTEVKTEVEKKAKLVGTKCNDKNCHIHGNLKVRGKTFEGKVIKKLQKRVTIEFERMIYVKKYERYKKSKTKIHARLQECMDEKINVGDFIKIKECRPLSKIIHFVVIEKIKNAEDKKNGGEK